MAKHEMPAPERAPQAAEKPHRHEAPSPRETAPRPKNRKARRIVSIVLVCAIVLGAAGGGGYYYLKNRTGKTVDAYPLSELGSSSIWYNRVNTGGQVRADKMQSVYLSSTQTVTEVYVTEGQQVEVGDPILAFDTTLDEVELTRKQIAIDQLKLELQQADETLKEIDTYKVGSPGSGYVSPMRTPKPTQEPQPTDLPYFQGGAGTAEDPYVFLWGEDLYLGDANVEHLLLLAQPTPSPTPTPDTSADPDASAKPDATQTPDSGEGEALAAPMGPEALMPVGVGHSYSLTALLAPVRSAHVLREAEQTSDQPTETPTDPPAQDTPAPPTEAPPADTPAQDTPTPIPTEPAGSDPTPGPTPIPWETISAEDILRLFTDRKDDPAALKALYEGLEEDEKQLIADKLSDEQMAALKALFTDLGEPEPVFPARTEPTPTPGQGTEPTPDQGQGGGGPAGPTQPTEEPGTEPTEAPETPEPTAVPEGAQYYMVFEVRENDSMQGELLRVFEVQFTLSRSPSDPWRQFWLFRVMEPMYVPKQVQPPMEDTDFSGVSFDPGVYYSAEEISQMRAQTQQEIKSKTIALKLAEQELKQVEYELSNGEVLCDTAGVVKTVLEPDQALEQNEPMVVISGGGGYFVTAYMGEFDMGYLAVGDKVTVENYMAGEQLEATITEISQYPTTDRYVDYYVNNANTNVSKYTFTVELDEDANVREGYYVNIYYSVGGASQEEEDGTESFYLMNAFIRTEGGRSYVYAAREGGALEKRYVTTGASLYGDSTEILGGLDLEEDYLAFPYGRSVKEGAPVNFREDASSLWSGY